MGSRESWSFAMSHVGIPISESKALVKNNRLAEIKYYVRVNVIMWLASNLPVERHAPKLRDQAKINKVFICDRAYATTCRFKRTDSKTTPSRNKPCIHPIQNCPSAGMTSKGRRSPHTGK